MKKALFLTIFVITHNTYTKEFSSIPSECDQFIADYTKARMAVLEATTEGAERAKSVTSKNSTDEKLQTLTVIHERLFPSLATNTRIIDRLVESDTGCLDYIPADKEKADEAQSALATIRAFQNSVMKQRMKELLKSSDDKPIKGFPSNTSKTCMKIAHLTRHIKTEAINGAIDAYKNFIETVNAGGDRKSSRKELFHKLCALTNDSNAIVLALEQNPKCAHVLTAYQDSLWSSMGEVGEKVIELSKLEEECLLFDEGVKDFVEVLRSTMAEGNHA